VEVAHHSDIFVPTNYAVVGLFIIMAATVVLGLFYFNRLIFFKRAGHYDNVKASPYECGYEAFGSPVTHYEPHFFKFALAFIIFDVEILILLP
jgi:NADH-quinone oxidoreductase subunit A